MSEVECLGEKLFEKPRVPLGHIGPDGRWARHNHLGARTSIIVIKSIRIDCQGDKSDMNTRGDVAGVQAFSYRSNP
jgi:hypothetical protein